MMAHYDRCAQRWQVSVVAPSAHKNNKETKVKFMIVRTQMERKLIEALAPTRLDITDDSHRHAGHGGHHPEGESHFSVQIVSAAFDGKGQVARQRMVYALLAEELRDRVHALALTTLTPDEDARRIVSR